MNFATYRLAVLTVLTFFCIPSAFFSSFFSSFWEDVGKTNILDEFASRLRLVDYPHGVMFHVA